MEKESIQTAYEKPKITDFGSLGQLTADCEGGSGGDFHHPGPGSGYGKAFTDSHGTCTSS